MRNLILGLLMTVSTVSMAQTVPNLEVHPNGYGGYTGTYGDRNFDIDPNQGKAAGHFDNRQQNNGGVRRPQTRNYSNSQSRCGVDANGKAITCR
jgi:hypothetical protein